MASDRLTINQIDDLANCDNAEKRQLARRVFELMRENERLRGALLSINGEVIYRRDKERDVFFPMLEANARIIDALSNKDTGDA